MRSETMKDVMLVLFTIAVVAVFLYALIVEPVLERRAERRWQAAQQREGGEAEDAFPGT